MFASLFKWIYLVFLLVGVVIGLIVGWFLFAQKNQVVKEVTTQTVLDKVTEMGFLVTRSVLVDQKAETTIDQGSEWSNFWWGYTVNSRALMRADIGVDLLEVKKDDIRVDTASRTVCIVYPNARISSISLEGDIQVESKTGVLKKILDNDTERDYNLALVQLRQETEKTIQSDTQLLKASKESADVALASVLALSDYEIVGTCR